MLAWSLTSWEQQQPLLIQKPKRPRASFRILDHKLAPHLATLLIKYLIRDFDAVPQAIHIRFSHTKGIGPVLQGLSVLTFSYKLNTQYADYNYKESFLL